MHCLKPRMAASISSVLGWFGRAIHLSVAHKHDEDGDAVYGFSRPEMFSHNVADTVKAYNKHIFVSTGPKSASAWVPKAVESHSMTSALAASAHKVISFLRKN